MPGRASRICTASGCGALVTDGSSRCPRHPPPVWQRSAGREGNTTDRGYGHDWRKLRAMVLERDAWLCQPSLQRGLYVPASEVDHVIGKAEWLRLHGTLHGVDDPSNLQAISTEEHRAKTLREASGSHNVK